MQREVVCCEQLLMSYASDTVSLRGPAVLQAAHRLLWVRSRCFDGRIGDGNRQRTCRALDAGIVPSASADGKVRQLALRGYSLE